MSETLRMWSAISFSVIVLGLGVPLWWTTTEVPRVALPYERIAALQGLEARVLVRVAVHARSPGRVEALRRGLEDSRLFSVQVARGLPDLDTAGVEELERGDPGEPGTLRVVETARLEEEAVVMGNRRSLYCSPAADSALVVEVLRRWVLREEALAAMVSALEQPGSGAVQEPRLKAEPCFDIVLTTVNPDPERVALAFDSESAVRSVIEPLLRQLRPAADLNVKSQWLYFVDIGTEPKRRPEGGWVIAADRVPHIISPLEQKLGSGVSSCPCLHFVLYVPRCSEAPLYFESERGGLQTGVVSPKWGGVQIINPSPEHCLNGSALAPDLSVVGRVLASHLRSLLGLRHAALPGAALLPLSDTPLRAWELDQWHRARALEQAVTASLTLRSLARLLGEISNIVINEEVGDAIATSVSSVATTFADLAAGRLEDALVSAREAFVTAEMAFGHPSLLALLYFPDDQKYAVYIPLFLPVMIPVVLSLKNIWRWLKGQ